MTEFDREGCLPPGDLSLTLASLRAAVLVTGTPALRAMGWDGVWRASLVDRLEILCRHLWVVGIVDVFVDGSFVTDKLRPGDIDGYFVCDFERFQRDQWPRLLLLDPVWDTRRRLPDAYGKLKPLMWHRYRVELFPHFLPPFEATSVAAMNPAGQAVSFPDFFRFGRDGKPRGIVRVVQEGSLC